MMNSLALQMLWVGVGGALGAVCRALIQIFFSSWALKYFSSQNSTLSTFPWHTACVNVIGSFLVGCLMGWFTKQSEWVSSLGAIGFLASFTTLGTWHKEIFVLLQSGHYGMAFVHWAVGSILCFGLCLVGYALSAS